jgi:hypothetical protein
MLKNEVLTIGMPELWNDGFKGIIPVTRQKMLLKNNLIISSWRDRNAKTLYWMGGIKS